MSSASVEPRIAPAPQAARVAVVGAMGATTMLFASLLSAYFVRRSFPDWRDSGLLWPVGLGVCALAASLGLEGSLRLPSPWRPWARGAFGLLSGAYLLGALVAVASCVSRGLALPHEAFVALLLGTHVLHALAAVFLVRFLEGEGDEGRALARGVVHFLTALLLLILLVLFAIR